MSFIFYHLIKMKNIFKFTVFLLCMSLSFFAFSQGIEMIDNNIQDIAEQNDTISQEIAIDDQDETAINIWEITHTDEENSEEIDFSKIVARFCNEWLDNLSDSLKSAVSQNTPFKICVVFNNDTEQDADLEVRIVDKVINQEWDEVCYYDGKNIQDFISEEDLAELSSIHIPAWNYVVKEFNINFPIWIDWEQKSCFTYHLISNKKATSMLNVVYNRYHDMEFFVWDLWDINNELSVDNAELVLNENKFLELHFNIKNIWNLEDSVILHWTLSNIFWFNKPFEFDAWNVWVWWTLSGIIDLWPLPSYGWLFNVNLTATATPFFSYNIDESKIDASFLEAKDFSMDVSYFEMPRLIIIILVFIILFIITLFRKPKQQVVYVNNPQQPMPNNGYWYQQPQQYQQPVQPQQYQNPGQQNQNQ